MLKNNNLIIICFQLFQYFTPDNPHILVWLILFSQELSSLVLKSNVQEIIVIIKLVILLTLLFLPSPCPMLRTGEGTVLL
jgi:hypothetical protein